MYDPSLGVLALLLLAAIRVAKVRRLKYQRRLSVRADEGQSADTEARTSAEGPSAAADSMTAPTNSVVGP